MMVNRWDRSRLRRPSTLGGEGDSLAGSGTGRTQGRRDAGRLSEVVQLTFDPQVISFREILQVFFAIHDPTTLNHQGADVGTQYRSVIFYHNQEQKEIAEQVIAELEAAQIWDDPIATEVAPFQAFYRAEDYHQDYFKDNSRQPYCQVVIVPKLVKFRKEFREKLKKAGK